MASEDEPRPYKVWDVHRCTKKSLVAKSLSDLKKKGCQKLGFENANVTAVLEEDGTEIDDDEYFSLLPPNPVILLLKADEKWMDPHLIQGFDQRDGRPSAGRLSMDQADGDSEEFSQGNNGQLQSILDRLKPDMSKIIGLSDDDMLIVAEADESCVSRGLGVSEREARSIQLACQRYMDDRSSAQEAIALLKTFKGSSNTSDVGGEDSTPKRQKTS